MRDGAIVQVGTPEELVGAPADDYVADFVRDVPRSHVLTLRWIARPPEPGEPLDGPALPAGTVIQDADRRTPSSSARPIRVVDGDELVGVVDRVDLLSFLAASAELRIGCQDRMRWRPHEQHGRQHTLQAAGARLGRRPSGIALLFVVAVPRSSAGTGTLPHDSDGAAVRWRSPTLREWIDDHRNANPLFLYFLELHPDLRRRGLYGLYRASLYALGWPGLIGGDRARSAWLAGGWRIALLAVAGFARFGVLGLWERERRHAGPDRVAAVLLSLLIGIPLGVWAGCRDGLRKLFTPGPRRHADHADVRLSGAAGAVLPHRRAGRRHRDA